MSFSSHSGLYSNIDPTRVYSIHFLKHYHYYTEMDMHKLSTVRGAATVTLNIGIGESVLFCVFKK